MQTVLNFAEAVLMASGPGTTHLKLQKLVFYAYGAARAFDEAVPLVAFQNWQHGPVCVEVWEQYRSAGAEPLPLPQGAPRLSGAALDAVRVYGALSAWQLREESHLEAPWRDTSQGDPIADDVIASHFRAKFASGPVHAPLNLAGSWTLAVDGLPALRAPTLSALAKALGR